MTLVSCGNGEIRAVKLGKLAQQSHVSVKVFGFCILQFKKHVFKIQICLKQNFETQNMLLLYWQLFETQIYRRVSI